MAARRAAVAVCVSLFDLGEAEKKLGNFFILGEEPLRGSSYFSLYVVVVVVVVEDGEVLAKGFISLRDILAVRQVTWCKVLLNWDRRDNPGMRCASKIL